MFAIFMRQRHIETIAVIIPMHIISKTKNNVNYVAGEQYFVFIFFCYLGHQLKTAVNLHNDLGCISNYDVDRSLYASMHRYNVVHKTLRNYIYFGGAHSLQNSSSFIIVN